MQRAKYFAPLLLVLALAITACAGQTEVTRVVTATPGPTPEPIIKEVVVTPAPPTVAPVPAAAFGPAIPQDKGYLVEEIGDGLYWVTEGVYQVMFLTTGEGVIAVDAPPSIGEKYLQAIAEVTDDPITHVTYSHPHADHIAAASTFPSTPLPRPHQ